MTGCGTCNAAFGSVAGALRHRSRSGGRLVERAVHLLERAALGFGAERPEADHAENIPGCEKTNAGPGMTRFGAAGLMMTPAPMITTKPAGPNTMPVGR